MNSLMKYLTITLLTIPLGWNTAFAKFNPYIDIQEGKNYTLKHYRNGGFELKYFKDKDPVRINLLNISVDSEHLSSMIQAYSNLENSKRSMSGGFVRKEGLDKETGNKKVIITSNINYLERVIVDANKDNNFVISPTEAKDYVGKCNNQIKRDNPKFYEYLKKLKKIE